MLMLLFLVRSRPGGSVCLPLPFVADLEQTFRNIHDVKGQLKGLREVVLRAKANQKKWLQEIEQRLCIGVSTFEALSKTLHTENRFC